jgi:hypothetical protein
VISLDVVVISRHVGHANPTVTLNIYGQSDPPAAAAIEIIFGTRMER